jgi:hypothetical protein
MGMSQPTRAPLQLEKLENEELLRYFCETHEEMYVLALWKRIADRQLNWMARRFCPHWYNPEWMVLGSSSRAIKRFQKHVCGFTAKLETPSFGAYKALLLKSAVIDEYRFVKGQGRGIFLQFGVYDVVDDTGALIRTKREAEADLLEQLERAREEDERRITGEEEGGVEPAEESLGEVAEGDELNKAIAALLDTMEDPRAPEAPRPVQPEARRRRRQYVSRRALRLLGVLAQPIPRPDAALSSKERKQIVTLLLLHHLTNEAKANSNDAIVRFYFRNWTKADMAVLFYGDPPDATVRNRNEKRVRDTLIHDLLSLRRTLKMKFNITTFRQV